MIWIDRRFIVTQLLFIIYDISGLQSVIFLSVTPWSQLSKNYLLNFLEKISLKSENVKVNNFYIRKH